MTQGPTLPAPTWFVGCGNMGGAIIAGWRSAGIDLSSLRVGTTETGRSAMAAMAPQ